MTRTLVVHVGGIGDFLLTCPALAQLDGEVELAGYPERLALAVEAGIAAAAHDLESIDFHSLLSSPSASLARFMATFDSVFVFMRDGDGRIVETIRSLGPRHVHASSGFPDASFGGHASAYYAECLGVVFPQSFRLALIPSDARHDVVVHPGSGSPSKNWLLESFQRLAAALAERGRSVAWVLGPAERERLDTADFRGEVLPEEPLVAFGRRLAASRLYVGNDSGITHLSALAGCPTVAVFGPTNPAVWGPLGRDVRVIQGNPWPSVDGVLDACLEFSDR